MRKHFLSFGLVMFASLAHGQLDSNSVTVTSSRGTSLQADQAVFAVFVDSGPTASLDDVLAALQGSGITLANFSGVNTTNAPILFVPPPNLPPQPPPPMLEWAFGFPVPLSKLKDTFATLTTLQQGIAKKNNGLSLTFRVQGTQVSPQLLQQQTCSLTDLIADARAQAQKLASAAGLNVGNVLALSSFTSATVPSSVVPVISSGGFFSTGPLVAAPNCSATVKFALTRF